MGPRVSANRSKRILLIKGNNNVPSFYSDVFGRFLGGPLVLDQCCRSLFNEFMNDIGMFIFGALLCVLVCVFFMCV